MNVPAYIVSAIAIALAITGAILGSLVLCGIAFVIALLGFIV